MVHDDTRSFCLERCAERANAEHQIVLAKCRDVLLHARAAGEWLNKAKDLYCVHGEWTPWLEENFSASSETARCYMRVAKHWDQLEPIVADETLTLAKALQIIRVREPNARAEVRRRTNERTKLRDGFFFELRYWEDDEVAVLSEVWDDFLFALHDDIRPLTELLGVASQPARARAIVATLSLTERQAQLAELLVPGLAKKKREYSSAFEIACRRTSREQDETC